MLIEKILIFVLFLCPIVFVHELGHFFFARLFGVRVETFSIGFGPKILKWKKGATEYALSVIPLGGYVKMFGDDPFSDDEMSEEDKRDSYLHKSKWARFWIVFGGPLSNIIFSFFLYFLLFANGEKVPALNFGLIAESSYFYEQGIRSGDVLKKINSHDVFSLTDVGVDLEGSQVKELEVERDGKIIAVKLDEPFNSFIERFASLPRFFRVPIIVDLDGNKFGISVRPKDISSQQSLDRIFEGNQAQTFYLYPAKPSTEEKAVGGYVFDYEKVKEILWDGKTDAVAFLHQNKFYPLDLVVQSIVMGAPADRLGIKQGDIISSVNGQKVFRFSDLREKVQENKNEKPIKLEMLRAGVLKSYELIPDISKEGDKNVYIVGIYSSAEFLAPEYVMRPALSLWESMIQGVERTFTVMGKTFQGFMKLVTARTSLKNIGGPIAIGKVAADSFHISLSYFFSIMALISVNLGIINLFPIPVLDGGHIMFLFLELINRGPLSRKKLEIAHRFGLSLLFLLIFVALFNDVVRLF